VCGDTHQKGPGAGQLQAVVTLPVSRELLQLLHINRAWTQGLDVSNPAIDHITGGGWQELQAALLFCNVATGMKILTVNMLLM
jgi:hypothetical protein